MSEVTEKRGEDVRKGPAGYPLREKKIFTPVSKYATKTMTFWKQSNTLSVDVNDGGSLMWVRTRGRCGLAGAHTHPAPNVYGNIM